MRYTIDPVRGIVFEIDDEPEPIPDAEAVKVCERISDEQHEYEAQCECRAQGAPTLCGSCE